jgi:phage gp36-like protein
VNIQLTTRKEMARLFKGQGLSFRTDLEDGDCEEMLGMYIDDATSTVLSYLGQRYESLPLSQSPWVRIRATWLACYYFSQTGGSPSLFYGRYQAIMDDLKAAKDGSLPILDNNGDPLPTRWDMVPSMSNINHDPRYRAQTRRVDPDTSTPDMGGTRERIISDIPGFGLF